MRFTVLVLGAIVAASSCGGSSSTTSLHTPASRSAAGFPATRFLPASPTYVLSAPTVREFQRATADFFDSFGVLVELGAAEAGRGLERNLGVDPLSPDAVSAMGVDLDGGVALFSEGVDPTLVVHLASPDATHQFFESLRARGMTTKSVIVDDTEIFTAPLGPHILVSWAITTDAWLLVHFHFTTVNETTTTWLTHARVGNNDVNTWAAWKWAADRAHAPGIVGFGDLRGILAKITTRVPAAVACVQLMAPINRIGFAIEGDGKHAGGHLAFDLGDSARAVDAAVHPPPAGWAATAAGSPVAFAWNLDVGTVVRWFQPCAQMIGVGVEDLSSVGIRAARVALKSYDPSDRSNATGAASLDLTSAKLIDDQLDQVPLRSHLESDHTWGAYKGHSLSIPTVGRLDYVVTDHLALLAKGDGLMDQLATPNGAATHAPLMSLDVVPAAMPPEAWESLLTTFPRFGRRLAREATQRLLVWHDAHVAVAIDGHDLVLTASGNRR